MMGFQDFVDPVALDRTVRIKECDNIPLSHRNSPVACISAKFTFGEMVQFDRWKSFLHQRGGAIAGAINQYDFKGIVCDLLLKRLQASFDGLPRIERGNDN